MRFRFYFKKDEIKIRPHEVSIGKLKDKIGGITNRNISINMEKRIERLNLLIAGWVNYFKITDMKAKLKEINQWTIRRLRVCLWKQWKKVKTKHNNLKRLGVTEHKAWQYANR